MPQTPRDVRCIVCGKLLTRAYPGSRFEVACPRCRAIWRIDAKDGDGEVRITCVCVREPRGAGYH